MDSVCFFLYRFFFLPVAIWILHVLRPILPAKLRLMLDERQDNRWIHLPTKPIWIHASSGEIEYAKSLIRELKDRYPQIPILVTYFSPSAKRLVKDFWGIDQLIALPWDRKDLVNHFLKFFQPRMALFARTDVWPEFAFQLRMNRIPSALFSATLSDASSRSKGPAKFLNRWALHQLSCIFCVSDEDKLNFQRMKVRTPLMVSGDTRFDQVLFRVKNPKSLRFAFDRGHKSVFVCGSTWPEDEAVLFPALEHFVAGGGRVIFAPHEISDAHQKNLLKLIAQNKWSYQFYSQSEHWHSQVLLIDEIGILPEVYSWGSIGFVGGSFKQKVHSVMEPLAAGLPVAVGPHHTNNREAQRLQHVLLADNFFMVTAVADKEELAHWLQRAAENDYSGKVKEKINEKVGATEELIAWIEATLDLFAPRDKSH